MTVAVEREKLAFKSQVGFRAIQQDLKPDILVLHVVLIALCCLTMAPLLWMVRTAFTPNEEVFRASLTWFPDRPTLQNFYDALLIHPVAIWLWNSIILSLAIAIGKLAIAVPAAFALGCFTFSGRQFIFGAIVTTMTVPYVVTLIPVYITISHIGWYDHLVGVIVPSIAFCGFAVFYLRQHFMMLPKELFEAADIDGASRWRMLWSIAIPNVIPSIVSIGVLSFLSAWNLYLWPLLVLDSPEKKTLSVGLKLFATNQEQLQQWGPLMAAAMVGIVPVMVIFVFAQRHIISSFVSSGLK